MNAISRSSVVLALAILGSLTATRAPADVTLHIHHTLVNGDTVSRPNYYTPKRMRATGPDGREYIYLAKDKRIAVIDHPTRTYWEGPMATADSIVDSLDAMRYREVLERVTEENKAAWPEFVAKLADSIQIKKEWERRDIAGYSCVRWTISVGSWMTNDRWVANALLVANYPQEIKGVLLTSVQDPLAKSLARVLISATEIDGLPLATSTTFRTPRQSGSYAWETYRIDVTKIPDTVWKVPADYRRMTWSDVKKAK